MPRAVVVRELGEPEALHLEEFESQPLKAGEEMVLKLTGKYTLKNGRIARIEIGPRAG